jgi:hypothetical protein
VSHGPRDFVGLGDLNNSLMDLLDHLRPERPAPAAHGLGIGHLAGSDADEGTVHQIGAHLAFQGTITPITNMLEDQLPQGYFGRRGYRLRLRLLG